MTLTCTRARLALLFNVPRAARQPNYIHSVMHAMSSLGVEPIGFPNTTTFSNVTGFVGACCVCLSAVAAWPALRVLLTDAWDARWMRPGVGR
jgi:hypothetical protein